MRYTEIIKEAQQVPGWEIPRVKIHRDEDDRTKFYIALWDWDERDIQLIWNHTKQMLTRVSESPDVECLYASLDDARADLINVYQQVRDLDL